MGLPSLFLRRPLSDSVTQACGHSGLLSSESQSQVDLPTQAHAELPPLGQSLMAERSPVSADSTCQRVNLDGGAELCKFNSFFLETGQSAKSLFFLREELRGGQEAQRLGATPPH